MSQNRKLTSLVSVVTLFGLTGLLAAGCGNKDGDGASCGEISARVSALQTSAQALTTISANIKTDVVAACAQIADMPAPTGTPSDNDVKTFCDAAKLVVDGAITANVSVVVVPPVCTVDAQAQLDCEGSCTAKADVTCDPGSVDVRCDPGELSVQCSGTCDVDAYCEGSAEVAVDCMGECSGSCEGTCSGKCSGTCDGTCSVAGTNGQCDGTCTGTCKGTCEADCMGKCSGSCKIKATGGVSCGANARCKGGCTGTATAPKCEANLKPPSCEGSASAQCNADCEGSASLKASCTDARVDIVGMVDTALKARLVGGLPKLLKIASQGDLALKAVGNIGKGFTDVVGEVGGCALELGAVAGQFTAAAQATATASVSVSASFSASANVSASAGG